MVHQDIQSHLSDNRPLRTGVLLIGHGTKDVEGLREFGALAELVARRMPDSEVATAFLEFAEPTIDVAVSQMVSRGLESIQLVPVLLFAAGHAKRDIPRAAEEAKAKHPQVQFELVSPLGCHAELLRRSVEVWTDAWTRDESQSHDAHWILVGRGSLDADATAETHHYAELLASAVQQTRMQVAFLSMAMPRMETVLAELLSRVSGPVLVVPHLLFQGDLLRECHKRVDDASKVHPEVIVRVAKHLGPSPHVADAIVDGLGPRVVTRSP